MNKRTVYILLLAAMLTSLAACGGESDPASDTTAADTTAAVAGGLAGLWYGEKEIPKDWAEVTAQYESIKKRSHRFSYACLEQSN